MNSLVKILNLTEKENRHDGLEDAKTLFEIYKTINDKNFNKNNYLKRIEYLKFLPILTSTEWVDRNKNNKKYSVSNETKIVFAYWKEKLVKKEVVNEEIDDVVISKELIDEINNEPEMHIFIKFYEIDANLNFKNNIEIKKVINKNKTDGNHYKNIRELEDFMLNNKNSIFLTNTKKFIIPFSQKFNHRFWTVNCRSIPNKLSEEDVVKKTKKFISYINNIKKAINIFELKNNTPS